MRKELYTGIFLEKKKFKKSQSYYYFTTPKISILIPKINNKYLVVSQKRIPINSITYEFPGGLVDKGKSSSKIACDELFEETGYISLKKPKKFLSIHPDPGRLNCSYECFFTDELKKYGRPEKGIKLHFFKENQILKLIKQKKFSHSCHISAFLFLKSQKIYLSDK